jgi:lon-related putative ATP-dependent protease
MIKAGALHRANGGYLMLDVADLLTLPLAYQMLKRALKTDQVIIESLGEAYGAITTRTLEPEPIPLDVKVILIGDPLLYYLLHEYDHEFKELFKVAADFDSQMDWTPETVVRYAQFVGTVCREENLRHFDCSATARVIEEGARLVEHQRKLTTKFGDIVALIREASYWAGKASVERVTVEHVEQALDAKIFRVNRIEERLREMIGDGRILIDTAGEVVGQVNGLSVLALGDHAFGKPSRITARTHVGTEGVVSIDREAKLGGRLHNKGSMILAGYLGGRYARDAPLALTASLAFEQLYEHVEGDSAAMAELCALLSSLADAPVRQALAVTGSVNQRGEIQAVGGVNEKIEGYFDVCRLGGSLTGEQGVIIPRANRQNLMLRQRVVEAVARGDFHIYAVRSVDEAMTLLTGVQAGEMRDGGAFPEESINGRVQRRLQHLAQRAREQAEAARRRRLESEG